jgi:hypothetical protein
VSNDTACGSSNVARANATDLLNFKHDCACSAPHRSSFCTRARPHCTHAPVRMPSAASRIPDSHLYLKASAWEGGGFIPPQPGLLDSGLHRLLAPPPSAAAPEQSLSFCMRHFTVLIHFYSCCVPACFACVLHSLLDSLYEVAFIFWVIFVLAIMGNQLWEKLKWILVIGDGASSYNLLYGKAKTCKFLICLIMMYLCAKESSVLWRRSS